MKLLDRRVADGQAVAVGRHVVGDRVQQVGLAEPGRPADEQRVVGEAGQLGDRERGPVREAVGVADHELVEREARVEGPRGRRVRARSPAPAIRRRPPPGATSSTCVSGPSTVAAHDAAGGRSARRPTCAGDRGPRRTACRPRSARARAARARCATSFSGTAFRSSARMRRQAWETSGSDTGVREPLLVGRVRCGTVVGEPRGARRGRIYTRPSPLAGLGRERANRGKRRARALCGGCRRRVHGPVHERRRQDPPRARCILCRSAPVGAGLSCGPGPR